MATVTLPIGKVPEFLEQWLHRAGNGSDTVEVEIQPGQLVVRQQLIDEIELRSWLRDAMARYESALYQLSDA